MSLHEYMAQSLMLIRQVQAAISFSTSGVPTVCQLGNERAEVVIVPMLTLCHLPAFPTFPNVAFAKCFRGTKIHPNQPPPGFFIPFHPNYSSREHVIHAIHARSGAPFVPVGIKCWRGNTSKRFIIIFMAMNPYMGKRGAATKLCIGSGR